MRSCLRREGSYYAVVVRLFFGRRLAGRDLGAGTSEVTARLFFGVSCSPAVTPFEVQIQSFRANELIELCDCACQGPD